MRLFTTQQSLKQYAVKETPKLDGVYLNLKKVTIFGYEIFIVRKFKLKKFKRERNVIYI